MELKAEGTFKGYTLIVGFPGIGLVGIIAARHIVDELNMRYNGYLSGIHGVGVATIKRGVAYPPVRMYVSDAHRLLCLLSDANLVESLTEDIADAIVKFAKEKQVERIISIAGIVVPGTQESIVYGVGATEKDMHFLQRYNIPPVDRGMTTGISAVLLLRAAEEKVPCNLLLGQLHTREDFRAAADVIKKLDEMFALNVDVGDLITKAERIEREVAEVMERLRTQKSKYQAPGMYG